MKILNWNTHIDNLCKVVSSKISLLQQLAEYVLLQGYILPLLDYGSITWGFYRIERLSKLQKRAARIILKADFDTPSVLMFQELGWLSVRSRIKYNKAVVIYKALNNMTPDYIKIAYTDVPNTLIKSKIRTKWYFIYTFSTYFAV